MTTTTYQYSGPGFNYTYLGGPPGDGANLTGTVTFNIDTSNLTGWYGAPAPVYAQVTGSPLPVISNPVQDITLQSGAYSGTLSSSTVSSQGGPDFYFQNGVITQWFISYVSGQTVFLTENWPVYTEDSLFVGYPVGQSGTGEIGGIGGWGQVATGDHWIGPSPSSPSGTWTTAADWSTGSAPGPSDTAIIDASGAYTVTSPSSVTVNNLSIVAGATLAITGGTFEVTGDISGLGLVTMGHGATLQLDGSDAAPISFTALQETLKLSTSSLILPGVSGFGDGDGIDVTDIPFVPGATKLSYAGGTLSLSNGSQTAVILSGSPWGTSSGYTPANFAMADDGHGGTLIEYCLDNRAVYITDGLGNPIGTGYIVDPHTVLTASHVVWDSKARAPINIEVFPGYDGYNGVSPGIVEVAGPYVTHANRVDDNPHKPGGIQVSMSARDFAVVDFTTDLTSYLCSGTPTPTISLDYAGGDASILGYPNPALHGGTQHIQTGQVQARTFGREGALTYTTLQAFSGDSGGPVFGAGGSDVGIVSSTGAAVQFTSADFQQINAWVTGDGYAPIDPGTGASANHLLLTNYAAAMVDGNQNGPNTTFMHASDEGTAMQGDLLSGVAASRHSP